MLTWSDDVFSVEIETMGTEGEIKKLPTEAALAMVGIHKTILQIPASIKAVVRVGRVGQGVRVETARQSV